MQKQAHIYIDGQAGTTALRIWEWLSDRDGKDLRIIRLPEHLRKDIGARKEAVASADIAILCLPDQAAQEVVAWSQDFDTTIIDASTAHRIADGWVYGLPELTPNHRDQIRASKRISNPGCYSSSFILLTRPLRDAGILQVNSPLVIHALSGYTGGGRALIDRWQQDNLKHLPYEAPYACFAQHKHIPEMMKYSQLDADPLFLPAVGPFDCGMRVQIPLHRSILTDGHDGASIHQILEQRYLNEPFVDVLPLEAVGTEIDEQRYDPQACRGTNTIQLRVLSHTNGHVTLMAVSDNLGKGASGMAIQSVNTLLGVPETTSLPRL